MFDQRQYSSRQREQRNNDTKWKSTNQTWQKKATRKEWTRKDTFQSLFLPSPSHALCVWWPFMDSPRLTESPPKFHQIVLCPYLQQVRNLSAPPRIRTCPYREEEEILLEMPLHWIENVDRTPIKNIITRKRRKIKEAIWFISDCNQRIGRTDAKSIGFQYCETITYPHRHQLRSSDARWSLKSTKNTSYPSPASLSRETRLGYFWVVEWPKR